MPRLRPLTDHGREFTTERHLATLSTIGRDGGIHVVAVGYTYVDGVVRIITNDASQKVRNVERDPRATVGQVAGPHWISIAGEATVQRDPEEVALAVSLYAQRYRQPQPNPRRVVIRIAPTGLLGSPGILGD